MRISAALCVALCTLLQIKVSWQIDDSPFLIQNAADLKCVEVVNASSVVVATCDLASKAQQFRWVSSLRLLSLSHTLCLEVQNVSIARYIVRLSPCDEHNPMQQWECKVEMLFGLKGQPLNLWYDTIWENSMSVAKSWYRTEWKVYGTNKHLCSHGYREVFTLRGNAFGSPCQFPFLYRENWYTGCTSEGRSDRQLWCATQTDYHREEKWGFCPTKDYTGWSVDPLTGVLYQWNTQALLTWHQARTSCQQQGADLLSIMELSEQTYISVFVAGLNHILDRPLWIGLNSLDKRSGWQWNNGSYFRYSNWAPDHPSTEPGLNCGVLNPGNDLKWESLNCNNKIGYICSKANTPHAVVPLKKQPFFCAVGWVPYNGYCYSLHQEKRNWSQAEILCHKDGANLASVHSAAEHNFLLSQREPDDLWIGLRKRSIENLFEWSDGSSVAFTKWRAGQPSYSTDPPEDCVLMGGKTGLWSSTISETKLGFICKKNASTTPPSEGSAVSNSGCKSGWVRYSSFCYFIGSETKSFEDAKNTCISKLARLVDVEDRYENAFLVSLAGLGPEKHSWLDMTDIPISGEFRLSSGSQVKFTNFKGGLPDRSGGCVAMLTGVPSPASAGRWEVLNCDSKHMFICKTVAEGVTIRAPPPFPEHRKCHGDWIDKPESNLCFKLYLMEDERRKTWFEARDFCRAIGGDLISLHSVDQLYAYPVIYSHFYEVLYTAWNGLSMDANNEFVWSDGSPTNFMRWRLGEPNNLNGNERCVVTGGDYRHWNDINCESEHDWICQIDKGKTPKDAPAEYNVTNDGWVEKDGSQYFINEKALSMEEAQNFCRSNNGDLAVITTNKERMFLWRQLKLREWKLVWYYIGLSVAQDKSISWIDGSPVEFAVWDYNQPDFQNNDENCVVMDRNKGKLSDENCGRLLQSICERSSSFSNTTMTLTTIPRGNCPPKWTVFNEKCYKFVDKANAKPWHQAREYCKMHGGNLVSILNHEEQAFLTTYMQEANVEMWTGLNDISWPDRYLWTAGKAFRFSNWAKGHPKRDPGRIGDKYVSHDCVVMMSPPSLVGAWKTDDCQLSKGFVCKRNLGNTHA